MLSTEDSKDDIHYHNEKQKKKEKKKHYKYFNLCRYVTKNLKFLSTEDSNNDINQRNKLFLYYDYSILGWFMTKIILNCYLLKKIITMINDK